MVCPHGRKGYYCERCGGNTTRDGVVVFVHDTKFRCPHKVRDGWCETCCADVTPRGVIVPAYYPTADEIAAACDEIQAGWSANDWRTRGGDGSVPYELQQVTG